jgi:hypothetical protein
MVRGWNLVGSDECYVLTSGTDNSRSMRIEGNCGGMAYSLAEAEQIRPNME